MCACISSALRKKQLDLNLCSKDVHSVLQCNSPQETNKIGVQPSHPLQLNLVALASLFATRSLQTDRRPPRLFFNKLFRFTESYKTCTKTTNKSTNSSPERSNTNKVGLHNPCALTTQAHIYIYKLQLDPENTAHSSEEDCMQGTYTNATGLQEGGEGGGEEEGMYLQMRWITLLLKTMGFNYFTQSQLQSGLIDRSIDPPGLAHSSEINKLGPDHCYHWWCMPSNPEWIFMLYILILLAEQWWLRPPSGIKTWPFPWFSFMVTFPNYTKYDI